MAALALLLAAAACTGDDTAGDLLPANTYPLQIGGISLSVEAGEQPWTKITETTDGSGSNWQWDGTEQITVRLGNETADYTLNADQSLTPDKQLYWTSTAPADVTAWYPVGETVDLSNQTSGLAYMLQATVPDATYSQPVNLTFTHQLAKVRINLSGTQALQVNTVEVYGYTSCTNHEGTPVVDDGAQQDWIKMHRVDATTYEANVVPDVAIDLNNFIRLNGTASATINSGFPTTLEAGNMYTLNITVGQQMIDISDYEGTTLTVSGKTILKGNGQQKNLQITVEPDTELTLQGVNLSYNEGPTIICQGTAHITLSGTNQLSPTSKGADPFYSDLGSGIEVRSSGTLTIESEPDATLTITRKNNSSAIYVLYGAGIGLYENANLVIKGGTITVTGGSQGAEGGANIGGFVNQNAGTITLEGGTFTLQDQCMLSSFVGAGSYGTCGTVTIRAGVTINGTTYAEDHVGEIK